MAFLVVLLVFVLLALAAAAFGADSRPHDPRRVDPQWPFLPRR